MGPGGVTEMHRYPSPREPAQLQGMALRDAARSLQSVAPAGAWFLHPCAVVSFPRIPAVHSCCPSQPTHFRS